MIKLNMNIAVRISKFEVKQSSFLKEWQKHFRLKLNYVIIKNNKNLCIDQLMDWYK